MVLVSVFALLALLPASPLGDDPAFAFAGVVVEEVEAGWGGVRAGIQPGDVILSWSREAGPSGNPPAAGGAIDSPFDLASVELHEVPRGGVRFEGRRGAAGISWVLAAPSGLTVRPQLPEALLARHREATEFVRAKDATTAAARWRQAAAAAQAEGRCLIAVWFLSRAAKALADARLWPEADRTYEEAIANTEQEPASEAAAQLLGAWGNLHRERSDFAGAEARFGRMLAIYERRDPEGLGVAQSLSDLGYLAFSRSALDKAEQLHRRALAIQEARVPGSLDLARNLKRLGNVLWRRGELDAAEAYYRRALALSESRLPEGTDVAACLNNLGLLAQARGDLDAAEALYRRALVIRERLAPDSLDVASSLNNLGNVAKDRGDLDAVEALHRRALTIKEKLAPDSLAVATSLNNLGNVAKDRGDLDAAEALYRCALTIRQKLAPDSLDVASSLNNLGVVAKDRGDVTAADVLHRRALAIRERLAPDSLDVAGSLSNLAIVADDRGDLDAAEALYRRTLTIQEKLAPDSLAVATSLNNLGNVAKDWGDLDAAEAHNRRALTIREKLAPDSLAVAASLNNLGVVAKDRGDVTAAEALYRRALTMWERLAPGSLREAESLHDLGMIHRRTGRIESASGLLLRALDALESQRRRLGGTEEVRSGFAARYSGYYHDSIETLLRLGREAEALHVLERSRARSLLALLAERDVLFSADLPLDLRRERALVDAEYDKVYAQLARLKPATDEARIESLLGRLRELRARQEEIKGRIREASPRLAALQYPQPLDLTGVRDALDPGTLFLAYSVGAESTVLFAVQPSAESGSGLTVVSLPVGAEALRKKVAAFHGALHPRHASLLRTQAAKLYDLLVRPAEPQIVASERLLFSPDGPLHTLPFSALMRWEAGRKSRRYLVESKPLHVTTSATVYAELKKSRRGKGQTQGRLLAFGDPRYPSAPRSAWRAFDDPRVAAIVRDGFSLTRLPFTRDEVLRVAKLFPGRAETYLGDAATEERAKTAGRDARYVHFACHAQLDERFPLNSALALSIPKRPAEGQANGLLQAWEIFDHVRLDADLVVLSACKTGLGKEAGGEGLLGLTRAFHYAGARSVLASLWAVLDSSTAELMTRFYRHLAAGKTHDAALRAAQLELIRTRGASKGDLSHPFCWAAFQLSGDWRH